MQAPSFRRLLSLLAGVLFLCQSALTAGHAEDDYLSHGSGDCAVCLSVLDDDEAPLFGGHPVLGALIFKGDRVLCVGEAVAPRALHSAAARGPPTY